MAPNRALKTGVRGTAEEVAEQQDDSVLASGGRDEEQQLASGRPSSTPFALVSVVSLVIGAVVAVVVGIAFLVFWLA